MVVKVNCDLIKVNYAPIKVNCDLIKVNNAGIYIFHFSGKKEVCPWF